MPTLGSGLALGIGGGLRQALPSRALELIGHPLAVAYGFDAEAPIEGWYEN
jgi:hypothetical protein